MIFLDNNSTTRVDDRVLEAMLPIYNNFYANASSNHAFGTKVNQLVKEARSSVASLIQADANEITFTSGATEAINIAIKGIAKHNLPRGKHIITATTEHPATLDVCKSLSNEGYDVTFLEVQNDGLVDLDELRNALRKDTVLVSIMMVNNETGVIRPIKELAKLSHDAGAFFMTDATQAVGKIPINVQEDDIDVLALSAHKFYGPKGVGALYLRNKGLSRVKIQPLIHGGGHERGLRSGTLNVPGIVGLGKASELAKSEMLKNADFIRNLRNILEAELLKIKGATINGNQKARLYNVSNIRFENVNAEALLIALDDIYISTGSACSSMKVEPSHVLKAMGLTDEEAYSSIRVSFGKYNNIQEVNEIVVKVRSTVSELRMLHQI